MASSPSPFSLNYIKRKRAIRNASKPTAVSVITNRPYINPQVASPLFTLLPAEIRNLIFQSALEGYPDPSRPYSLHSFWYRPGYTHARKIATELLLTCRRVYLETDLLPLVHNEHLIWGVERSRVPPQTSSYLLDNRLKLSQRNAIQYVHLFTQQFWLEDWKDRWLAYSQSWPDGCPPRLRITIRHTDWWYNLLGENSPLALDPKRKGRARVGDWLGQKEPFEPGSWGQRFVYMKGLRIFQLELETVQSKRLELDVIIGKARIWKFPLGDGRMLVLDKELTERNTWTGSKHFKGFNAPNVQPGLQLRQGSTATFSQSSKKRTASGPEELAPGDILDYYVVTLTWRAQDLPQEDDADEESEEGVDQGTTNSTIDTAAAARHPRVYHNRMSAIPTFYGNTSAKLAAPEVRSSHWFLTLLASHQPFTHATLNTVEEAINNSTCDSPDGYILVTSSTGNQGSAVIDLLLQGRSAFTFEILAQTRSPNSLKAQSIAARSNSITILRGDLSASSEIFTAAPGPITTVFSVQLNVFGSPENVHQEETQACALIDAALSHGVRGIRRSRQAREIQRRCHARAAVPNQICYRVLSPEASAWTYEMDDIEACHLFMDNVAPDIHGKGLAAMWANIGDKPLQLISTRYIGFSAYRRS